jgi:UDP-glucose 4-epimerase
MRSVVTGGAGFIGHHLVRALVSRGDDVVVLDDLSTGSMDRLRNLQSEIRVVEGDIRDPQAVRSALSGADVVFHQAALPSVPRSLADPHSAASVNIAGTIEVMLGAASSGVRRVILAGSSSVYGDSPEMPRRESQRLSPVSPYAGSKAAAEVMLHSLGVHHGVETISLRYFNVFGAGQDPHSQYAAVVPLWITAALAGTRPIVFGDGTVSRDFTHVHNVVSANLLAADARVPSGNDFNIGCGAEFTLLDLLAAIGRATGRDLEPEFRDPRAGDVQQSVADISRARAVMGYDVLVPFEAGVEATVRAYQDGSGRA